VINSFSILQELTVAKLCNLRPGRQFNNFMPGHGAIFYIVYVQVMCAVILF